MSSHEPVDTTPEASGAPAAGAKPGRPPRLEPSDWAYALKRALKEFSAASGIDLSAMLTHFTVLSLAPVLLAIFSVVSLILTSKAATLTSLVADLTTLYVPVDYQRPVADLVTMITGSASGSAIALTIAVATGLWSSFGYVTAFSRCMNTMYGREEGRGLLRHTGTMLLVSLAMLAGVVLILVSLALNQPIVSGLLGPIAEPLGLGRLLDFLLTTFLPVWAWAKWVVVLALMTTLVTLLYYFTPNVRRPRFTWISPGSVIAVLGIAVAGLLLWTYLTRFARYSLYGAIGAVIGLVFALWLVNTVLLVGAEVDAEVERARELVSGIAAEEHIQLPPRSTVRVAKMQESRDRLASTGRERRLSRTEQRVHRR
ncbi:YihY/virulence factor BrkB family protein [Raineyella fluvialis]|uniref:YihY family inner membrane protein n=1 Tax=Raineyella fluvialis TaxID=2662261 RepID=A0A5Q2F6M0_9ACTN|nr:YihY/virulence factor BrkB family protein [Raineyella fluvialis]QGF22622.1 hypothetical protein Rai3103_01815 [Raineyella fluvialis]